jgi:voltage-gated potassium channel
MGYRSVRRAVFLVLNPDVRQTTLERAGNIAVGLLILANVTAVILESMPELQDHFGSVFAKFEAFSLIVFTVEYLLRLWTCVEDNQYRHPIRGRLRFMRSPFAVVDLAVLLPAYLPGWFLIDFGSVRVIRVVRILRVLKLARYSRTLRIFGAVFKAKRPDIALMTLFLAVLVVVASSLMYFVEHAAQPDRFSSIPAAMWWSVMTLTTVGYGDIYPITPLGKLVGAMIALIGIGFFALPAGVLAGAFAEELAKRRSSASPKTCPHCGKEIG